MLVISTKKLNLAKLVLFSGISLMVVGVIWFPLMGVGLALAFLGAHLKSKLFRCPNCGAPLLNAGSRADLLFGSGCDDQCGKCGAEITLKFVD